MKNFIRVFLEGIITNVKRITFAADRVTDMEIRNRILEGRVTPTEKVAEVERPIKISDDKLAFISQYLSDSTILKKRKN